VGPLLPILAAVLVQGVAEEGLVGSSERPWLVIALCALPHALALLARRAALAGEFAAAERRLALLGLLPVLAHALALGGCGWLATLERVLGVRPSLLGWPNAAALAGLAPFVAYSLLAIDARARVLDPRPAALAAARRLQARLLLGALAPLLLYVALAGAIGRAPSVRARIEHVGFDAALYAGALLALFLTCLPFVVRASWSTRPLPAGAVRELFTAVARRARFRCRDVLAWDAGQGVANAVIVGVVAPFRLVLVSDGLLASLPARELAAVFAHEMGHARRHHVLVFVAWTAALILGVELCAVHLLPEGEVWGFATLGLSLVLWYLGFGWLSRRFELDADLFAVETTGDARAMQSALERVGGTHGGRGPGWRHFPSERRIAFLETCRLDPDFARAFHRRARALSAAGAGACLVVLGLWGRELWSARPQELVRAQLAMGDVQAARAALARAPGAPEELSRQVEAAVELGLGEADDGERLLAAARAAADEARAVLALDLVVLGSWRDGPRFAALVDELIERLPGELREDGDALGRAAEEGDARVLEALRASLAVERLP
jgi:Zn-dependent protease with chaperone function